MEIELLSVNEAIDGFNPLWAICLAVLYFVVELLDSGLVFSLTQHKAMKSATLTFVLYLVVAIEIAAIITNYLYIIPIAIGAALGSFVAVKHERKKRPLKK
jgi:quinol-cytochrome oxidoreductase complex cytochrome b subunit